MTISGDLGEPGLVVIASIVGLFLSLIVIAFLARRRRRPARLRLELLPWPWSSFASRGSLLTWGDRQEMSAAKSRIVDAFEELGKPISTVRVDRRGDVLTMSGDVPTWIPGPPTNADMFSGFYG